MSERKTCEEWYAWGGVHPREVLWDWRNETVKKDEEIEALKKKIADLKATIVEYRG